MHPIHSIIAAPLHFLRLPLSSIFCFFVALGPSSLSSITKSQSAVAHGHWLPHPNSVPDHGVCKLHTQYTACLVREIEVIMHMRVRLCLNAWELAALSRGRLRAIHTKHWLRSWLNSTKKHCLLPFSDYIMLTWGKTPGSSHFSVL